MYKQFVLLLI